MATPCRDRHGRSTSVLASAPDLGDRRNRFAADTGHARRQRVTGKHDPNRTPELTCLFGVLRRTTIPLMGYSLLGDMLMTSSDKGESPSRLVV